MDDEVERLKSLLLRMAEVDVSSDVYTDLRTDLLCELNHMQAEEGLHKHLCSLQDQVKRLGARDPDFDMKRFMDDSWE